MSYVDDRLAIADNLQRYATCLDAFDFDGVAGLFTDDAVIQYGGYPVFHAKADPESVRTNVGDYRDRLRRTADGWRIFERRQKTGWKETRTRTPL
jgi:3-phenylpropionate/cinnamic acid dioxygenase small subunit